MKVTQDHVAYVKKMHASGKFHSRIARRTGLSRATIRKIVDGWYDEPQEPKRFRDRGQFHHHHGKPERCPGCGGLIYRDDLGLCTLCTVREAIAKGGEHTNVGIPSDDEIHGALHAVTYAAGEDVDELDIRYSLAPDHLARALEIREQNLLAMAE